ncbi:MAG: response regulator [Myxococcota bacterium]
MSATLSNTQPAVLLIEDDAASTELMRRALRKNGVDAIRAVTRCETAVDLLRSIDESRGEVPPKLILLDLNLPGYNGFDFLDRIRNDHTMPVVPVIVLSTSACPDDIERAYRCHASAYVTKPHGFRQLCELVARIVNFWLRDVILPYPRSQRSS